MVWCLCCTCSFVCLVVELISCLTVFDCFVCLCLFVGYLVFVLLVLFGRCSYLVDCIAWLAACLVLPIWLVWLLRYGYGLVLYFLFVLIFVCCLLLVVDLFFQLFDSIYLVCLLLFGVCFCVVFVLVGFRLLFEFCLLFVML